MLDVAVGDLVVVRFSPASAAKLRETAEDEHADRRAKGLHPVYAVSTFALRLTEESETVDSLVERICRESGLGGRNVFVVTDRLLADAGFTTERSEPPIHHYDVVLGDELVQSDVEKLSVLFESGRRRHPLWTK